MFGRPNFGRPNPWPSPDAHSSPPAAPPPRSPPRPGSATPPARTPTTTAPHARRVAHRRLPRRAPGRHRHARPGSPALRRLRRHRRRQRRRAARPAEGVDGRPRRRWPAASPIGAGAAGAQLAPPDDTGEALDLTPANLTVTFGFGASLLRRPLRPRGPQAGQAAAGCPTSPATRWTATRSDGDLCVQACANDPQVAFHAIRNLARIGRGLVTVRWSQLGFGRTSTTSRAQATPRNLMGFKDGTANIKLEDARPSWPTTSGSAATGRRARLAARRHLPRGAPHPHADRGLGPRVAAATRSRRSAARRSSARRSGGTDEFQTIVPRALPADAHVRLAAPRHQRRHQDPAPRLLVHRRPRVARPARRRPLLPRLHARPERVRRAAEPPRRQRRAQRVHQARRLRPVGRPAGGIRPGGYVGQALFEA